MHIYLFIYTSVIYLFILERVTEIKHRGCSCNTTLSNKKFVMSYKKVFLCLIILLLFISAFRADNIGADHGTYIFEFNQIKKYGDAYFREKGYVLLNKIIILLGGNTTALSFAVSFMLCMSFYLYIVRYVSSDYYIISLIIFVCQPYMYIQSTFNIMRQGCATAVILFSIPFLLDKKWIKFIAIILLASTFHTSALVILLLIIFKNINFDAQKIRIAAIVCILMNFVRAGNWPFVIMDRLMGVYSNYSTYEASLLNFKPYVIAIFVIILYFSSIYHELYKDNTEKFFVDPFLISLAIMIFCVQNDILYRLYIYLAFMSVPGTVTICKNLSTKSSVIEYCFIGYYSAFYIGYISLMYITQNIYYYPFKFVFEK